MGQQAPDIALELATGGLGVVGKADDVLDAALDARRLDLPPVGPRALPDLDQLGQQRLFDDTPYVVDPEPIAPIPPDAPGPFAAREAMWPSLPEIEYRQTQWLDPNHPQSWQIGELNGTYTHEGLADGVRLSPVDGTARVPNATGDALVPVPELRLSGQKGAFGETNVTFDLEQRGLTVHHGQDAALDSVTTRAGIDTIAEAPDGSIYVIDGKYRSNGRANLRALDDTDGYGMQLTDEWVRHHADALYTAPGGPQISREVYDRIMAGDYTSVMARVGPDVQPQYVNLRNGADMDTGEIIFRGPQLDPFQGP